jgi:hypothetical protein
MRATEVLTGLGLTSATTVAGSSARFPDGAHYRVEIPSVEGPDVLRAVLDAATERGITVNRVSQGSGAMLMTLVELREMSRIGADAGLEVSLFIGPREEFGVGVQASASDGGALHGRIRGLTQLRYAVEDVMRAAECGIRGFLVADSGLLEVLVGMQSVGQLPADVVWKVSVMLAPSNPVTLRQLAALGGHTVNVPSDLTLDQLAEMRAVSSLPLDLYVEAPDALGGTVRGEQCDELVRVGAPMYVKFGLRNARALYPAGEHLVGEACLIAREKVHRAAVALEWLQRFDTNLVQSPPGAPGLGIPQP